MLKLKQMILIRLCKTLAANPRSEINKKISNALNSTGKDAALI